MNRGREKVRQFAGACAAGGIVRQRHYGAGDGHQRLPVGASLKHRRKRQVGRTIPQKPGRHLGENHVDARRVLRWLPGTLQTREIQPQGRSGYRVPRRHRLLHLSQHRAESVVGGIVDGAGIAHENVDRIIGECRQVEPRADGCEGCAAAGVKSVMIVGFDRSAHRQHRCRRHHRTHCRPLPHYWAAPKALATCERNSLSRMVKGRSVTWPCVAASSISS